jgi:hypothetical protein
VADKSTTGAFLGLLKSSGKKPKPKREPVDDAEEGSAYSKVGEPLDDEVGEETEEEEPSAHGAAFDSLADALSIPPEKRARARAALKSFVKACSGSEDY